MKEEERESEETDNGESKNEKEEKITCFKRSPELSEKTNKAREGEVCSSMGAEIATRKKV